MIFLKGGFIALSVMLLASNLASSQSILGSDVVLRTHYVNQGDFRATVVHVEIRNNTRLAILSAPTLYADRNNLPPAFAKSERAPKAFLLTDYLALSDALAVLPAGYPSRHGWTGPTGLVRSNKIDMSPPESSERLNGIVCSDRSTGSLDINFAAKLLPETHSYSDCLQAGPLLLERGQIAVKDNVRDIRVPHGFICLTHTGQLLFGFTTPTSIADLVAFLKSSTANCKDALRLSGETSAGLAVKGLGSYGEDDTFLPSVIALTRARP